MSHALWFYNILKFDIESSLSNYQWIQILHSPELSMNVQLDDLRMAYFFFIWPFDQDKKKTAIKSHKKLLPRDQYSFS